jgi:hypothetical protein
VTVIELPLTVKLLKDVMPVGKVEVAVRTIVPALVLYVAPAAPVLKEPHVRVAPLTIVRVPGPVGFPPLPPPTVIAPLTVKAGEPLAAKVRVPAPTLFVPN